MSNLININRKIFKNLSEDLQISYVSENVYREYGELLDSDDLEFIIKGISKVIRSNEEFHETYGIIQKNGLKQVDETCDVKGFSEPSGFYYSGNSIVVCPFDWSWDDNGDFDYSFTIAKNI